MEEGFWKNGPEYYMARMANGAVMVYPEPTGILTGDAILEELESRPRWTSVLIDDRVLARDEDTVVLAYRARALVDGGSPYFATCASTYVGHGPVWRLLAHNQTPETE
tara:strand:+ start:128 stop:451 length:324 start_codon:yes stop_codon:yes gene_type:complete